MTPWTPALTFVTPGDQNANLGLTFASANYIQDKSGLVHFEFNVQFAPVFTNASGALSIGNLPVLPTLGAAFSGQARNINAPWPAGINTVQLQISGTDIRVVGIGSLIANQNFGVTQFTSGGTYVLAGNGWYF